MRGSIAENDFASLSSAEWSLSGHQERLRGTLYGASPEFGKEFLGNPVRDFFKPARVVCVDRGA